MPSFEDGVALLSSGEEASIFDELRSFRDFNKAVAKMHITEYMVDCLKHSTKNWNPGDHDKELLLYSHNSNVYLRFRFFKGKLAYVGRNYDVEEYTLIQPAGEQFSSKCNFIELQALADKQT
jgi:hypothetical protein